MSKRHWPKVPKTYPVPLIEHAGALQDSFEAISQYVRDVHSSESLPLSFPRALKKRVCSGLIKGIEEAVLDGTLPKDYSVQCQKMLCDTILYTVANEAAMKVHDRIPVHVFTRLHSSYTELIRKLQHDSSLDQAPKVPINASLRNDKSESKIASNGTVIPRTNVKENCDDSQSYKEESLMSELHNLQREVESLKDSTRTAERHEEVSGPVTFWQMDSKNVTADSAHRDRNEKEMDVEERQSSSSSELFVSQETSRDRSQERQKGETPSYHHRSEALPEKPLSRESPSEGLKGPILSDYKPSYRRIFELTEAGSRGSLYLTFHIEHQASVNRLEAMQTGGMLQILSESLASIKSRSEDIPSGFQIAGAGLLFSGDLRVMLRLVNPEVKLPSRWIDGWCHKFQEMLEPIHQPHWIKTTSTITNTMDFASRRIRAKAIQQLVAENSDRQPWLSVFNSIIDIGWARNKSNKKHQTLMVSFSSPVGANGALNLGLQWQGVRYTCVAMRLGGTCGRCQSLSHRAESCKAEPRCGKCAGNHETNVCTSQNRRCAHCGGPHSAKSKGCLARRDRLETLQFHEHSVNPHNANKVPLTEPNPMPSTKVTNNNPKIKSEEPFSEHEAGHVQENVLLNTNLGQSLTGGDKMTKPEGAVAPTEGNTESRLSALEALQTRMDLTLQQLTNLQTLRGPGKKRKYNQAFQNKNPPPHRKKNRMKK